MCSSLKYNVKTGLVHHISHFLRMQYNALKYNTVTLHNAYGTPVNVITCLTLWRGSVVDCSEKYGVVCPGSCKLQNLSIKLFSGSVLEPYAPDPCVFPPQRTSVMPPLCSCLASCDGGTIPPRRYSHYFVTFRISSPSNVCFSRL